MRDQGTEPFTAAEARVADRLHRWSDHGVVPIDATDIAIRAASTARVGRRARGRSWSGVGSRRTILGLAALLLLAAGLALAAAAILLRTSPEDAYRAVVVRQVDGGVDVWLVDADGGERLLRRVTHDDLMIDPRYTLGYANLGQSVSQQGWLELSAMTYPALDRTGLARWGLDVLIDLADPARAPIIVPANGFLSGRWGPDGRWAHFCAEPPDCGRPPGSLHDINFGAVRVLDPDRGLASEIIVPQVETFGGGPAIFWAADGSGFLGHDGTQWGVTPLDGGPFRPGAPRLLTRELDLDVEHGSVYRSSLGDPGSWKMPGGEGGLPSATLVDAQLAADGEAVWQLLVDAAGPSPRSLLARLTGPGTVESVRAFELPTPGGGFTFSPDDTVVAIGLQGSRDPACPECGTPMWEGFVLAPVGPGGKTVAAGPAIEGTLAGLVPAVIADAWPGR